LLADRLALIVDPLFTQAITRMLGFVEAWSAVLAFSFQLYLDFSAYTEMAIGTALIFGFLLPENFRRPYLSVSIRDFWRRWHITLSNFLRDYLYIPMGGSRNGVARYLFATLATMALCGLWHGAGWTFVAWGLWHGVGLATCRGWQQIGKPLPSFAGWALTMLFVLIGWVVFRAADFRSAESILGSLVGFGGWGGRFERPLLMAAAALASVLVPSAYEMKDKMLQPKLVIAVAAALLALACILEVGNGPPANFIYFRF
jgi:D-alanyl-lipoteichoic acid acyltransferase DltB (MBOAT superfamily)